MAILHSFARTPGSAPSSIVPAESREHCQDIAQYLGMGGHFSDRSGITDLTFPVSTRPRVQTRALFSAPLVSESQV